MKAVQIGGGLVGNIIAEDMSRDFDVTVVDTDGDALRKISEKNAALKTSRCSCTDAERLAEIIKDADIVTAGVPGRLGREMMNTVIKAGKNLCDISFMPEDFEDLDRLAKEHGVTVIPDIGVAPGMSNFLLGRGASLLDETERAIIYVGGIPEKKIPPFNYQITWSASDVIEEYTRPARYVKNYRTVVSEAMEDLDLQEFPGVGLLETFITDGLRSLVKNIKAKDMQERTMRWPGHAEQMRLLRAMGLFSKEKRCLGGSIVCPREVACDLLFPMWKMDPDAGDRDLTVMRVVAEGYKGCDRIRYTWDLCDRFDEETWNSSMSRCTGLTCSIFAHAVAAGLIKEKGVIAPEKLACSDDLYDFVLSEQKKRGIIYTESVNIVKNAR
ncbi:MAG: saccharopine dehydrogenase NADP-binding domain-containing protein [Synergistes sp.]|nr:saccharopine dehydrogenase NADP-binding domain-containing protein [Synergistes sp.]MCR5335436.1 saccharopine dehydrogenase NADP-binding domain-containing protein [Synergistes sp.]